jgi:Rrf2 family iron-sulfur cluster assembly transcriptional regulator
MFNRSARLGIAAMTALAEGNLTAAEIARKRRISPPYLAKILTTLSRRGLIRGARGPGGGYLLARPAERITLLDIVACFEPVERVPSCPLGRGVPCAGPDHCALHEPFQKVWHARAAFLAETTLAGFAGPVEGPRHRPGRDG